MSDELQIEGKPYISSKRAAQLSGYAQDYIGQLSRKGLIDSRRIGGLWYISFESLGVYKKKADEFKPEPPARLPTSPDPETLVFFDGKEYVSAARAAEITGYAQDYAGQLARSGTVLSQQVGNRWYIQKDSITKHKSEKDSLLGAVQSESVGLAKASTESLAQPRYHPDKPLLNYFEESGDLLPVMTTEEEVPLHKAEDPELETSPGTAEEVDKPELILQSQNIVPIRRPKLYRPDIKILSKKQKKQIEVTEPAMTVDSVKRSSMPLFLGAAATIIVVISIGYGSILKQNSVYATNISNSTHLNALPAAAVVAFGSIGNFLEPYLTRQLTYTSSSTQ